MKSPRAPEGSSWPWTKTLLMTSERQWRSNSPSGPAVIFGSAGITVPCVSSEVDSAWVEELDRVAGTTVPSVVDSAAETARMAATTTEAMLRGYMMTVDGFWKSESKSAWERRKVERIRKRGKELSGSERRTRRYLVEYNMPQNPTILRYHHAPTARRRWSLRVETPAVASRVCT